MTERDFDSKLRELDRLLNDPEVRLEPARVWSLLAEVADFERLRANTGMGLRPAF